MESETKASAGDRLFHDLKVDGTWVGACRFCGQSRIFDRHDDGTTQEDIDEATTLLCNCDDAIKYQNQSKVKGYAEKRIHALFGEESTQGVAEIMEGCVYMMLMNNVRKVTIQDENGVKGTVTISATNGKIKIKREQKVTKEEELN